MEGGILRRDFGSDERYFVIALQRELIVGSCWSNLMAGTVNRVILIGNLGRDPEVRQTQDAKLIVTLSIATSETWRDRNTGERKEKTEWHRVVIFNENLAKIAEQYLKKGTTVYVEGQLQTRKYIDKDGVEKYSTEVVLLNYRGELTMLGGRGGDADQAAPTVASRSAPKPEVRPPNLDDDVPF